MAARDTATPNTNLGGVNELRARCERCITLLRGLIQIHLKIDSPTRKMRGGESNSIARLRKICLHVLAISGWEISADVEHVMATELRAAYEQMTQVWKRMPQEFRLDEIDDESWARKARSGLLATYDHPTPQGLALGAGCGGFSYGEDARTYAQLSVWLGHLGIGYAMALSYAAKVLRIEENVESQLTAALENFREETM